MKLLKFLTLPAMLVSLSCHNKTNFEPPKADSTIAMDLMATSSGDVYFVSMIKLIANPEKYHGKRVLVEGYLDLAFENNALYLHKEDNDYGILKNAVWVDLNKGIAEQAHKCKGNYVFVDATFDAGKTGHMGAYSGTLTDVTRVEVK